MQLSGEFDYVECRRELSILKPELQKAGCSLVMREITDHKESFGWCISILNKRLALVVEQHKWGSV